MKPFTEQEIRIMLNQIYREELSFSGMVEVINNRISESNKPQFKDGDFLHSDWYDENITIICRKINWSHIYYHVVKTNSTGLGFDKHSFWPNDGDLRLATEAEKQELLDALAKEGKRWNEEKKCVEDIPKRKFKIGDKVQIKEGISSKTHNNVGPSFVEEMDDLIGKIMTVYKYAHHKAEYYVVCEESGCGFHEDWLEPYVEELKEGDLAIFWDDNKRYAAIKFYERSGGSEEEYFRHRDHNGSGWKNVIKFESVEQYEKLIKGEI